MSDGPYPANEHDHLHAHGHHHHHHHGAPSLPEEPLDPANQSLADALKSSFRLLKVIMIGVVVVFLVHGMLLIVDQNEVVVVTRFGKQDGPPREPGLHVVLPFPISERHTVETGSHALVVEDFWFHLSDLDKTKKIEELIPRGSGLDPAMDGALLTGDRAIMNVLARVHYQITDAGAYVRNVRDVSSLLGAVVRKAAVAEAARVNATDTIWKAGDGGAGDGGGQLAAAMRARAQAELDAIESGITLDDVLIERSHYPLQVKDDYTAVLRAEQHMRERIQDANKAWEERLKGAAGPAWEPISREIRRLDQVEEDERAAVLQVIDELLVERATGQAGGRIKLAERDRDRIVADTIARADRFKVMLDEYRRNPELVRQRLQRDMMEQILSDSDISRWVLPAGQKVIWLNKDPEEERQRQREHMRRRTGVR